MAEKQYAERNAFALDKAGGYYMRHVQAMTAERLHGKGDIAAELGHRDHRIDVLETALQTLLPGLVLDLRYADADDDRDAMQSRIDTVTECFPASGGTIK